MHIPLCTTVFGSAHRTQAILGLAILNLSILQTFSLRAMADESEAARIVHREKVVHFFGGSDPTIHFDLHAGKTLGGRLSWQLTMGARKVAFRDLPIEIKQGQPTTVEVHATLPPVRDGVILPLELKASLIGGDDAQPAAEWKGTLWLFPENPFTDRRQWLASLKIHLIDPDGATAAALDKLEVPYKGVRNLAALADMSPGLIIVGESTSWAAQRDLAPLVLETAAKGTPVLCLAPADGSLPLPLATTDESSQPLNVSFRRRDIIQELDKRLDAEAWVPGQSLAARGLAVSMERGALVGKFAEPDDGWPWLELKYAQPKSRLIWCGWPIVRDWDQSPAPRYLFARLLEVLANDRP